MGSFKSFGRKGFGGPKRDFRDNRGNGPKPFMFDAECAKCGRPARVPFKPTGERPVYCKDCFAAIRAGSERMGAGAPKTHFVESQQGGQNQITSQLATLNAKLDKILLALTVAPGNTGTIPSADTAKKKPAKAKVKAAPKKALAKKKK